MARVAVRRINEWDGPAMLKIYQHYVGTAKAPEAELPDLRDYVQRIDRYTYGLGWIMCEIDSTPAGFCHLTENRNDPENLFSVELQLYVKPEFSRIGVGKALWSLIRDMMQYGSRKEVTVRLREPNPEGMEFLKAMGFKENGREDEAILMRYELAPADPDAKKPIKPYLIENADYEHAREQAAKLVRA